LEPLVGEEGSMHRNPSRGPLLKISIACGVVALAGAALNSPSRALAVSPPGYGLANVGAYGGEPSITSDSNGILYYTSPSTVHVYRSADRGATWTQMAPDPDSNSGDDCLATDESNSLYWCNLGSSTFSGLPLQADVLKDASNLAATQAPETCTTSCTWVHGTGVLATPTTCGTSCSPLAVDRQWTAASLLTNTSTDNAEVVLMYHDFGTASQIWVNVSTDGGHTYGAPVEVIATSPTPGAVVAQGYTNCNTVPAGVDIVPQKLPNGSPNPHAGRIYVAWIAADLPQNATGCNLSMAESFHTGWVAWSDGGGAVGTWNVQGAIDMGVGHDMSTPFAGFTLDNQGNPYLAFASPAPLTPGVPPTGDNPAVCAAESTAGTVETDASCNYHMWVVACQPSTALTSSGLICGDGAGLTVPGSASAAHEVDANVTTPSTDVFPTIAVGDPGKVDVSWLSTPTVEPTDAAGKFLPGGCSGSTTPPVMNPPPPCPWQLSQSQSLDLNLGSAAGTWTTSQLTATPMHVGDVCNLGIACITGGRNLLDFEQETIDPTTGCAHISFPDDNAVNLLRVANQTSGSSVLASIPLCNSTAVTPESPASVLLPLAGLAVAGGVGAYLRRRRRFIAAI
jgi:hypothetical protein